MAKRPDTPCAGCGELLWSGSGSKPAGQRLCRACRAGGRRPAAVDTAAEPAAPGEGVAAAAAGGSRRVALESVRAHLARLIDSPDTPVRDQIAAARELRAVVAEIDVLSGKKPDAEPQGEGAGIVDLAAAIAKKRPSASA